MFVLERQLAMPSCIYRQEGMIEAKYIWSVCDATTKKRTCIAMVESQINPNQATWWIDYPRQGNKNYRDEYGSSADIVLLVAKDVKNLATSRA
jgi:hypothetical protein